MTFKVYIGSHGEGYRAVCARLGLEVIAADKGEVSRRINALIKEKVDELEAKGLSLPPEPPKPLSLESLDGTGKHSCKGGGCGSQRKNTG